MNFPEAIASGFKNYAVFRGRASRSEYWYWVLFNVIVEIVLGRLGALRSVAYLALIIPTLAVGVRRMHDANYNGWWIICPVVNVVFACFASVDPNKYGTRASGPSSAVTDFVPTTAQNCPVCGKIRLAGQGYCAGCGSKF